METEAPKPQTGGLKLMTVFIVVLALHVVVIGGISAYHIFKRGTSDTANNAPKDQPTTETTDTAKTETVPDANTADGNAQTATAPDTAVAGSAPTPADTNTAHTTTPVAPDSQQITPVTPVAPIAPVAPVGPTGHEVKSTAPVDAPVTTAEVTVKAGDSLYKIAKANHTTVDSIKKLNGLANDNLKIGQKLKVASKGAASTAVAQTTVTAPAAPVKATTPKVAAAAGSTVYTVNKGDTLTKIAKQFKTTTSAIMTANKMSDPSKLSIGAKLKIPVQQATTQSEPAPSKAASAKPAPAPAPSSDLVMADHPAAH